MVAVKQKFSRTADNQVDIAIWLNHLQQNSTITSTDLIQKAAQLAQSTSQGLTTFYGQPCLEQGLELAEVIADLKLDQEAIAAGILFATTNDTNLPLEKIQEQLGENVTKLVRGLRQTSVIDSIRTHTAKTRDVVKIDRIRKLFLAMVSDIRVVLIKLAERLCILRGIKHINIDERKRLALETLDIYAPLANRLGIGQLKWELEDIAFHYTDPETYKKIAAFLAERRVDREKRIQEILLLLKENFAKANIQAAISGRAKHIYSIYRKAQKKHLDYKDIYDYSALRILVPTLDDCYKALSIVNNLWEPIPEEFDDYIVNPKPNGYRSIHTAVVDQNGKHIEIQVRTQDMHEEAEHGVAAHWLYKEEKTHHSGYEKKITYLRQLLAWHKEMSEQEAQANKSFQEILEDRIYVFTPAGDTVDLPVGATPLDFAYHIHTGLGHRCRGAKVNGHIVQLTHALHTGDRVDIITTQQGAPSRDWLKKDAGYVTTARARAKIALWFKHQDITQYIETGKQALERELIRIGIQHADIQKIATRFNFKNADALLASIGHGSLRAAQIAHTLQRDLHPEAATKSLQPITKSASAGQANFHISGIDDLLTRIARCCKPIPGDKVIGYITQGRGVTIHRLDCKNISRLNSQDRMLQVNWDHNHPGSYLVDLQIHAQARETLVKDISALLANAKVDLIAMNSMISKKNNALSITLTVQIHDVTQLKQLKEHLQQLPRVIEVRRLGK
jgi:GTP pyrophosphokinase